MRKLLLFVATAMFLGGCEKLNGQDDDDGKVNEFLVEFRIPSNFRTEDGIRPEGIIKVELTGSEVYTTRIIDGKKQTVTETLRQGERFIGRVEKGDTTWRGDVNGNPLFADSVMMSFKFENGILNEKYYYIKYRQSDGKIGNPMSIESYKKSGSATSFFTLVYIIDKRIVDYMQPLYKDFKGQMSTTRQSRYFDRELVTEQEAVAQDFAPLDECYPEFTWPDDDYEYTNNSGVPIEMECHGVTIWKSKGDIPFEEYNKYTRRVKATPTQFSIPANESIHLGSKELTPLVADSVKIVFKSSPERVLWYRWTEDSPNNICDYYYHLNTMYMDDFPAGYMYSGSSYKYRITTEDFNRATAVR